MSVSPWYASVLPQLESTMLCSRTVQWLVLWLQGQVVPPASVWVLYRFCIFLALSVWFKRKLTKVCVSQQGVAFAVPLTMVTFSRQVSEEPFHTGLACLSRLSITQIAAATCIHMHAPGTRCRPLAVYSGGACANLCSPWQQQVTAAARHMSAVICMV